MTQVSNENIVVPELLEEPSSMLREDKLYLVTHAQLSAGYQTAQIAHATADFIMNNPQLAKQWHTVSNSVIILEAKNAEHLSELQETAETRGIITTEFREPDLGDEITAVTFAPGVATRKLLSSLPCAGRKMNDQTVLKESENLIRVMSFEMMDTKVSATCNSLQQGRLLREYYFVFLNYLENKIDLSNAINWDIPNWVHEDKETVLTNLPSRYVMDRFLTLYFGEEAPEVLKESYRVNPNNSSYLEVAELLENVQGSQNSFLSEIVNILLSAMNFPGVLEGNVQVSEVEYA